VRHSVGHVQVGLRRGAEERGGSRHGRLTGEAVGRVLLLRSTSRVANTKCRGGATHASRPTRRARGLVDRAAPFVESLHTSACRRSRERSRESRPGGQEPIPGLHQAMPGKPHESRMRARRVLAPDGWCASVRETTRQEEMRAG
jgi:hypothetical protein